MLHLCHIQTAVIVIGVVLVKWIFQRGDVIMIGARNRVETGVKLRCDFPNAMHGDVGRKKHVQTVGEISAVFDLAVNIEMGVVVVRMDASVGASAPCDADGLAEFQAETTLQLRLHAGRLRLYLPSTVVGTVVRQMNKVSFHVTKIQKKTNFAFKIHNMRTSFFSDDTICAVATPLGMGAIAVIRLSGPKSHDIVCGLFQRHGKPFQKEQIRGYQAFYGHIVMPETGEELDEVLVTFFVAPNSFTGEDSVEISVHGSVFIQQRLLELLVESGARMAMPGEFTRRAFVNRKFDLAQAEAVADIIASQNEAAHRLAMNQLKGGFSKELQELRSKLLEITSLMELELDFSEEDVEFADRTQLKLLLSETQNHIANLVSSFRLGNAIKNGIPVAIVGETNTGKSTLLNALLGEDRAIVSDIAGTTRDTIEEVMNLDGVLFRFIDTAGIRETDETIEKIGIERTFRKIGEADIVIGLMDATRDTQSLKQSAQAITSKVDRSRQTLLLLMNKTDLCQPAGAVEPDLFVSAKTGEGLDQLRSKLVEAGKSLMNVQNTILVTNVRHFEALKHASESLTAVQRGLDEGIPTDLVAQDLREALYYLGSITGEITTDEVLGSIFGRFCIGK